MLKKYEGLGYVHFNTAHVNKTGGLYCSAVLIIAWRLQVISRVSTSYWTQIDRVSQKDMPPAHFWRDAVYIRFPISAPTEVHCSKSQFSQFFFLFSSVPEWVGLWDIQNERRSHVIYITLPKTSISTAYIRSINTFLRFTKDSMTSKKTHPTNFYLYARWSLITPL